MFTHLLTIWPIAKWKSYSRWQQILSLRIFLRSLTVIKTVISPLGVLVLEPHSFARLDRFKLDIWIKVFSISGNRSQIFGPWYWSHLLISFNFVIEFFCKFIVRVRFYLSCGSVLRLEFLICMEKNLFAEMEIFYHVLSALMVFLVDNEPESTSEFDIKLFWFEISLTCIELMPINNKKIYLLTWPQSGYSLRPASKIAVKLYLQTLFL